MCQIYSQHEQFSGNIIRSYIGLTCNEVMLKLVRTNKCNLSDIIMTQISGVVVSAPRNEEELKQVVDEIYNRAPWDGPWYHFVKLLVY